ncbi:MAG TPA: histidine phosphatase family protein [Candidatus Saccharimonadales bacterium]|nr:histidine phosphatase family protein [Candidatus Saccharimonadales bacterium]
MKHLYFVRHGLSVMNKKGVFSGRTETPLDPEGITQARAAGKELRDLQIDLIVSSPMERCRETATIIAKQIGYPVAEIIFEDLFMERAFGVLEGTEYRTDMDLDMHEGVETAKNIIQRARKGIEYLEGLKHDNILVVSHGAIGRALRHALHPEIPYHGSERFENAKIVQLL